MNASFNSTELGRYLVVGGAVTLADIVLYNALTGGRLRLSRIPANILSTSVGMVFGFAMHHLLVFRPHDPQVLTRMVKYIITVGFSVYGVQNAVIFTLGTLWRQPVTAVQRLARYIPGCGHYSEDFLDRMTGKLAAIGAGVIWNYVLFKWFVYA